MGYMRTDEDSDACWICVLEIICVVLENLSFADVYGFAVTGKRSAHVGRRRTSGLLIRRTGVRPIEPCLLARIGILFSCVWFHEHF